MKTKKKKYFSNAKWTKIKCSQDWHETFTAAEIICERLLEDYGEHTLGCEIRGHCLKTWVSENEQ